MNDSPGSAARLAALDLLGGVLDERRALSDPRDETRGLDSRDQAFATHLAYGVLRWLSALDWLAGQLLDRPLKRRDRDIQRLLLLGLEQLWHGQTPPHAAVHATAECARLRGKAWAVGLVNAVLRRFLREGEAMLAQLESRTERYAHPTWLLDRLQQDWPEQWQDIATQNNAQAPLWLRVNRQRVDIAEFDKRLQESGFQTRRHPEAPEAIAVEPAVAVAALPGFADGLVSVQDPAAQLAAILLDPQADERVLDACAAPGGKTSHLLERQPGLDLLALDRDPARCRLIRDNLGRLGLDCAVRTADAAAPAEWWDGVPFDRILLDAPCSATGVIRRHPEIKWLRDEAQVRQAVADQQRLLDGLWPLLGAGGILVYATCSVLKCENNEQIHRFLSRHPDAETLGEPLGGRQILPGQDEMDGFWYATLRKRP